MASRYTDHERQAFIEHAEQYGVADAMQQLGYPASDRTGYTWLRAAGAKPADPETTDANLALYRRAWDRHRQRALIDEVLDAIAGRLRNPVETFITRQGIIDRPTQLKGQELRAMLAGIDVASVATERIDSTTLDDPTDASALPAHEAKAYRKALKRWGVAS